MSDRRWDDARYVRIDEPLILPPHLSHLADAIRGALADVDSEIRVVVAAPEVERCPECGQLGVEVTMLQDAGRTWVHGPASIGLPPCPRDHWERRHE